MNEYAWIKDAINGGALAIVALGAHVLLTKTWPGLIATFTKEIEEQRKVHVSSTERLNEMFVRTLEQQRKDFLVELQAERSSNSADVTQIITLFNAQQRDIVQLRCLRTDCGQRQKDEPIKPKSNAS